MVAPLGAWLLDRRDRALILLGFAAALRRSELVALRVADVRVEEEGLVLTLRRSKTNQEGRLETIAVPYGSEPTTCPVRALRAWLAAAGLVNGPLFVGLTPQGGLREAALGDRMVAHVVKRRCKAAGIDPVHVGGHSLRRGFATAAARAKKPDRMIKRHGRWKSTAMLDRYIEDGTRWDDNATPWALDPDVPGTIPDKSPLRSGSFASAGTSGRDDLFPECVRLRGVPILLIAPLGLATALLAHVLLQTSADFNFGALGFSSHAHTAVGPVAFVEVALALWLLGVALRDALTTQALPYRKITAPPQLCISRFTLSAGLVALIAVATLFGMEYAESGSAAFGLGWLGGALIPGAIALITAIATAVGALYLALAGHLAGFDHLVALFAAALARFIATLLSPTLPPQRISTRRITERTALVSRHAGLRAPPRTTR